MNSLGNFIKTLENDEVVLWKFHYTSNELKLLRNSFFLLIFIWNISFFSIFIYFFSSPSISIELGPLGFVILAASLVSIVPLYMLVDNLFRMLKTSKKISTPFWKMRNYENFGILTNKRWIQKSIYVESSGGVEGIFVNHDVGWINIEKVKIFYACPEKKNNVSIYVFATEDIYNEESNLSLSIPKEEYLQLFRALKSLVMFLKEESNSLANGDTLYYISKKE